MRAAIRPPSEYRPLRGTYGTEIVASVVPYLALIALATWFIRARCACVLGCTPSRLNHTPNVAVALARFGAVGTPPAALTLSNTTFGFMYAQPNDVALPEMYVLYAVTAFASDVCSAVVRMN